MYTDGVNTYNKLHDEKPQITSQNFNFDGESFSEMMDKEEAAGGGLRETAQELAEDESILSTDEENRAMIRRGEQEQQKEQKPTFPEDKARLLKLMDMSNKVNMSSINITKSKKELENTLGKGTAEQEDTEDITSVVAKIAALRKDQGNETKENIEAEVSTEQNLKDLSKERKKDDSQTLHETEEELLEDLSILSTEEENLEMARRNAAMNKLSDDDFKTSEEDMLFLNEIVAMNNQMHVNIADVVSNTQNVLSALENQTKTMDNRIDISELSAEDVDCLILMLKHGEYDSSDFLNNNNPALNILSEKFITLLKDSILNKKVFRIDFDNQISVIIRINTEGKISAEFLTSDKAIETYLKNNLHILKDRFKELNIDYEELSYRNTEEI